MTSAWTVRAGVQYDQTPTRDGQRDACVPDGDHRNVAVGTSYRWSRMTLDLAATYVGVADATIDRPTAAYADTAVQTPILTAGEARNACHGAGDWSTSGTLSRRPALTLSQDAAG